MLCCRGGSSSSSSSGGGNPTHELKKQQIRQTIQNKQIKKTNQIQDNEYGIYFKFSPENNISKNIFNKNKNGIINNYSSKNHIKNNNFEQNLEEGIILQNSSNYNYINCNNFIKNKNNAYFIQSFSNKWEGNYWDDWNHLEPKKIYGELYLLKNFIILNWFNIDKESVKNPYKI